MAFAREQARLDAFAAEHKLSAAMDVLFPRPYLLKMRQVLQHNEASWIYEAVYMYVHSRMQEDALRLLYEQLFQAIVQVAPLYIGWFDRALFRAVVTTLGDAALRWARKEVVDEKKNSKQALTYGEAQGMIIGVFACHTNDKTFVERVARVVEKNTSQLPDSSKTFCFELAMGFAFGVWEGRAATTISGEWKAEIPHSIFPSQKQETGKARVYPKSPHVQYSVERAVEPLSGVATSSLSSSTSVPQHRSK
jgi:hypothetical protein